MRLSYLLPLLVMLSPAAVFATGARAHVKVEAHVPLVAKVEGPAQVVLAPGERARIRVQILANVPWTLSIQSPNASAEHLPTLSGPPGGAPANSSDVEISCSPKAPGRQVISLVYTLMPR